MIYGISKLKEDFVYEYSDIYKDGVGRGGIIKYPDLNKIPIPLNAKCAVISSGKGYGSYKAMLIALDHTVDEWGNGKSGMCELNNGDIVYTTNVAYHGDDSGVLVYSVKKDGKIYLIGNKGLKFLGLVEHLPEELFEI